MLLENLIDGVFHFPIEKGDEFEKESSKLTKRCGFNSVTYL
jgi:hypothetical protein